MRIIKEILNKIKITGDSLLENNSIFNAILIILVAFSSYGLGQLSQKEKNNLPINIYNAAQISQTLKNPNLSNENIAKTGESTLSTGKYVASKNGTKYHAPWCSGAQRIKKENQIWFSSKEEAEAAGYTPASNCPGI
ncbi:MAG: hypothetical protein V1851_02265 [Patescibacteria group bacterium]